MYVFGILLVEFVVLYEKTQLKKAPSSVLDSEIIRAKAFCVKIRDRRKSQ